MLSSLRFTGVAAVAVLWSGLLVATALADLDLSGQEPLSYLGTRDSSAVLFTATLAVSALLLAAFHQHVRRRFPVSTGFSAAMLTGLAGQLVAAFVPIAGDPTAHRIHSTSALVLGASLPLLMWRFATAQPVGSWRRLAYGFFWAETAVCLLGLHLSGAVSAPGPEILAAAVFHAWVLTLTFHPMGSSSARIRGLKTRPERSTVLEGNSAASSVLGEIDLATPSLGTLTPGATASG